MVVKMKQTLHGKSAILYHLLPYAETSENWTIFPFEMTQEGVSEAIKTSKGNTSKYLTGLIQDNLVILVGVHLAKNTSRKVQIYALTTNGVAQARLIQDQMSESTRWLLGEEVRHLRKLAYIYRKKGSYRTCKSFLDTAHRIAVEWKMDCRGDIAHELDEFKELE